MNKGDSGENTNVPTLDGMTMEVDYPEGDVLQSQQAMEVDYPEGDELQSQQDIEVDYPEGDVLQSQKDMEVDYPEGDVLQSQKGKCFLFCDMEVDNPEGNYLQSQQAMEVDYPEGGAPPSPPEQKILCETEVKPNLPLFEFDDIVILHKSPARAFVPSEQKILTLRKTEVKPTLPQSQYEQYYDSVTSGHNASVNHYVNDHPSSPDGSENIEKEQFGNDNVSVNDTGSKVVGKRRTGSNYKVLDKTLDKVQRIWNFPQDFDVPVAKVNGRTVTDTDIRSLQSPEWLTDNVIDTYLKMLCESTNQNLGRMLHIDSVTMSAIMNRTYSSRNLPNLGNCVFMVGAYCKRYHWVLVILDMLQKAVYYYDPVLQNEVRERRSIKEAMCHYISSCLAEPVDITKREWKVSFTRHASQTDSYNCGIYCLIFAEEHLKGDVNSLKFIPQIDLDRMRLNVAKKIMVFEVYLTGCCPKCKMSVDNSDNTMPCADCGRSYHFTKYCVGTDTSALGDGESFRCTLCRMDYWPRQLRQQRNTNSRMSYMSGDYSYNHSSSEHEHKQEGQTKQQQQQTSQREHSTTQCATTIQNRIKAFTTD